MTVPVVLTVAGSDSSGGAGIQADLRTFSALGTFGTTAITAVTAQNLDGVLAVEGVPSAIVGQQIAAVTTGFDLSAAKTGMLWSAETVRVVSEQLSTSGARFVVVDPVMVSTSGSRLLQPEALHAYRTRLLPRCSLITPNLDEAPVLLDCDAIDRAQMPDTARELATRFGCAVLLKGGHLEGDPEDVLYADGQLYRWRHARLEAVNTHGSGCMLSAAVTSLLARDRPLPLACEQALAFVHNALASALKPAGSAATLAHIEVSTTSTLALEAL